jgi:glucose-1-phosphate cytidylyltransferase
MKVVILCGGKGTRMREETEFRPKPLVEIGNMPVLWHIMKIYSHYGFKEFILPLGYKGSMIKEYFMNFEWLANDFTLELGKGKGRITHHVHALDDWTITFADTGLETNTGGRVKKIEKYIDGDEFFLTYGDAVADVDIPALLEFHRSMGKTITLTGIHPPSRFGVLEVTEGLARTFREKPTLEGSVNGGFFVCNRKIFDYLDDECTFEQEPLRKLASEEQLAVYDHLGFWQCMDTFKEVESFNRDWAKGVRPWVVWNEDNA